MFNVENNKKVGAYLKKLITKRYASQRQFCRVYLKAQGIEPDDEELRKMGNRISQIINGKKAIQTYDLPVFTELLDASCEEILSAGKTFTPIKGHITNYEIAFSKDPGVWQKYIDREDKLILNTDEYNKTLIDYAIDFKNYRLLKYLMDKKYIWFVDESKYDTHDRTLGFGAGTSIKRREITDRDCGLFKELSPIIGDEIRLRKGIISLALENEDLEMLTVLRAREIPAFNFLSNYVWGSINISCKDYYDEDLVELISKSGSKVLEYFATPYDVIDQHERRHTFIYPFIGEVVGYLVKKKDKYAEPLLRMLNNHNRSVLEKLQGMVNEASHIVQNEYGTASFFPENDAIICTSLNYYETVPFDGYISYSFPVEKNNVLSYSANVIRTDAKSDDLLLSNLIKQLNESFDKVLNIKPTNIKEA